MSKKVVVAMSGGVDSSVAAALLKEQGCDVTGVTLRLSNWEETEGKKFGGCCGSKDFYDARSVAQTLDIPHYAFDYVDHFRTNVIEYFKDSYLAGETPNPCIACNNHVKFDRLLEQARALGADYLATGHYARVEPQPSSYPADVSGVSMDPGLRPIPMISSEGTVPRTYGGRPAGMTSQYLLKKAKDPAKDQSYVLYGLGQKELSSVIFPLGDYSKTDVREIARRHGLKTADKPDSQEICFVPNADYKAFIQEETAPEKRPTGPIRHVNGAILGQHKGLPFYTIGQREGLGISVGHPLYVVGIETMTNTLVVGEKDAVLSKAMVVRDVNWVSGPPPEFPAEVSVKIRYKHQEAAATLSVDSDQWSAGNKTADHCSRITVHFKVPQSAITPGQAAVFYNGDQVLGGGTIHQVLNQKRKEKV